MTIVREIPVPFDDWQEWVSRERAINDTEALMQADAFDDPGLSLLALEVLREAVVDCIELLSDRDQFVIEAIWFERITVRELAARMGICKSRTHEIACRAVKRLGAHCATHPAIAAYVG